MQTSLTRSQFLDRPLERDDLQTIALMLTDWFQQRYHQNATLQITLTLWGFAQKQGEPLTAAVQSAAAAQNLSFESIALSGPDFLVVQSPVAAAASDTENAAVPARAGDCVRLLQTGPFENLWCEIALGMSGQNKKNARRVTLAGVVFENRFVLKAIWPEGDGEFKTGLYASAPWSAETNLLQSLSIYQSGEHTLPNWARENLFFDDNGLFARNLMVWFLVPRKKGWRPLLGRVALSGVVALTCGTDLFIYCVTARHFLLVAALMTVAVWGVGFHVLGTLRAIRQTRRVMRANYEKLYAGQVAHLPVQLEDAPSALQNDPALHKLSQEVRDMGGVHYKDVTIDPPLAGRFFIRLFLFPDTATLFVLSFMIDSGTFRMFPVKPVFLVRTNFADGFRLVTVNSGTGFRKNRLPHVICRRFVGVSAPDEMLQKHLRAVRIAETEGHKPLPLVPDTILEQMDNETREAGEVSKKYGHMNWADAFRMVFDLPRREYAEDA